MLGVRRIAWIKLLVVLDDDSPLILRQEHHAHLSGTGGFAVVSLREESLCQHHGQGAVLGIIDQRMPQVVGGFLILTPALKASSPA